MSGLDEMMAALRALGKGDEIEKLVAKRASETVLAAVKKTAEAGTTPEGVPWVERKIGGRAYRGAASKLSNAVYGNLLKIVLSGPEVFGHFGAGGPVRRMLPDAGAGLPKSVSDALELAAEDVFEELVK